MNAGMIFGGPMIRAINDLKKTQTRRLRRFRVRPRFRVVSELPGNRISVVSTRTYEAHLNSLGAVSAEVDGQTFGLKPGEFDFVVSPVRDGRTHLEIGGNWRIDARGTKLWVRETWCLADPEHYEVGTYDGRPRGPNGEVAYYDASDAGVEGRDGKSPWISPLFMPRWASRITLDIVNARVQRLQDISEEDAQAEGVEPFFERFPHLSEQQRLTSGELAIDSPFRASFACTWDAINGERAPWSSNPWVLAISFRKMP